jgi:hypothetical protein
MEQRADEMEAVDPHHCCVYTQCAAGGAVARAQLCAAGTDAQEEQFEGKYPRARACAAAHNHQTS